MTNASTSSKHAGLPAVGARTGLLYSETPVTGLMNTLAVLVGLGGVVGGLLAALHTVTTSCAGLGACATAHPHAALGVVCMIGSILTAALFWAVGAIAADVHRTRLIVESHQ